MHHHNHSSQFNSINISSYHADSILMMHARLSSTNDWIHNINSTGHRIDQLFTFHPTCHRTFSQNIQDPVIGHTYTHHNPWSLIRPVIGSLFNSSPTCHRTHPTCHRTSFSYILTTPSSPGQCQPGVSVPQPMLAQYSPPVKYEYNLGWRPKLAIAGTTLNRPWSVLGYRWISVVNAKPIPDTGS